MAQFPIDDPNARKSDETDEEATRRSRAERDMTRQRQEEEAERQERLRKEQQK